jgi:putative membrane protein
VVAPILSEVDHARVSAAVSAAEAHSAGEIVTIVTDRSDGYSDIALAWAAFAAATALLLLSLFPSLFLAKIDALTGNWGTEWTPGQLLGVALALVTTKFLGVLLVQLWQPLKFWLIPGVVKSRRVLDRAITCFKVGAERRTHGRTGILIYLSLREHRAEIVADAAIVGKVAPEVWGEAMAAMLVEIRAGRLADGMIAAVGEVGKVLAEHFPRADDDTNELPDRLIEV